MSAAHIRLAVLTLAGLAAGAMTALAILPQARERLFPGPGTKTWGQALIGGPFTLTDHAGKRVTDADFRGRTMLVLFGYTSCPDVCPAALQVLSAALAKLGPDADRFAPVLVTVDPERDTPQRLSDYVHSFHPRLLGLTGTPAEIAGVLQVYRIPDIRQHALKREDPAPPARNTPDHRALIYVIGPDGRFHAVLNYASGADAVAARLAAM